MEGGEDDEGDGTLGEEGAGGQELEDACGDVDGESRAELDATDGGFASVAAVDEVENDGGGETASKGVLIMGEMSEMGEMGGGRREAKERRGVQAGYQMCRCQRRMECRRRGICQQEPSRGFRAQSLCWRAWRALVSRAMVAGWTGCAG
jgi:hypothetical protein